MRPRHHAFAAAVIGAAALAGCATAGAPESVVAAPELTCDRDFFSSREGARFLGKEMALVRNEQPLGVIPVAEALAIGPGDCDAAFEIAREHASEQHNAGLGFAAQRTLLAAIAAGLVPDTSRANVEADMNAYAVFGIVSAQDESKSPDMAQAASDK